MTRDEAWKAIYDNKPLSTRLTAYSVILDGVLELSDRQRGIAVARAVGDICIALTRLSV